MCGIIGYLGKGQAQDSLIDGLKRLEYRGYDSAGVAFHEGDNFSLSRETGRVKNLAQAVQQSASSPPWELPILVGPLMEQLLFQIPTPMSVTTESL